MAKKVSKAQKAQRKPHTRPKRRRMSVLPYLIMAILIIGIPLGIYQIYVSNVDRSVKKLEEAIRTEDMAYLEENTDRLPLILDVLKKSYSEDGAKQEDFYKNMFENLDIEVINQEKNKLGKDVKVKVINVNYIDAYDSIEEMDDESKIHQAYMELLASPSTQSSEIESSLYLKRKFSGYEIYESKEFINAILGGALEYAEGNENEFQNTNDSMDDSIGN